ncbi:unnamed protein product [Caenorhabditis sp. 36 PRJEB53466]|nr:unnamed protein product [Caenorhabditis sp. 36 PRJEB53466]
MNSQSSSAVVKTEPIDEKPAYWDLSQAPPQFPCLSGPGQLNYQHYGFVHQHQQQAPVFYDPSFQAYQVQYQPIVTRFTVQKQFNSRLVQLMTKSADIYYQEPVPNYNYAPPLPITSSVEISEKRSKGGVKKTPMHLNTVCSTCGTRETKLWRRDREGRSECNPCNMYFRVNGIVRPAHLWNKPTMKRQRRPCAPINV